MKRRNILGFLTALVAMTGVTSCGEYFLESTPIMSENEETFYSNDEQMFKAVMAAYDMLQHVSVGTLSASYVVYSEVRSDNARGGGGNPTDGLKVQDIEAFRNDETNDLSDWPWYYRNQGVYRCNLVINAEYDSELARVYKAEAKFLRAWYMFDLMRYYGPCCISLESTYPDDYKFKRATREEVNQQMERDLLDAIENLETSHTEEMVGRITKTAAQALLGKVYLYWADWNNDDPALFDKAAEQLKAVMTSGKYSLINDYSQIFAPLCENNSESIFEIQHCTSGGTTSGPNDNSEGSWLPNVLGPRELPSNDTYAKGNGFLLPTKELYNFYMDDDLKRRKAMGMTVADVNNNPDVTWNIEPSETAEYKYWNPKQQKNNYDFEGWITYKYSPIIKGYNIVGTLNKNYPGNERVIRYSDVYLMLAEAYLRGSNHDEATAESLIDELRAAHVGADRKSIAQMKSEMDANPAKYYLDSAATTLDVVWYERRCEFAGEGDRWFDIVRSGRAERIMTTYFNRYQDGTFAKEDLAQYPNEEDSWRRRRADDYPDNFVWDNTMNYLPVHIVETTSSGGTITTYPDEAYE